MYRVWVRSFGGFWRVSSEFFFCFWAKIRAFWPILRIPENAKLQISVIFDCFGLAKMQILVIFDHFGFPKNL